MSLLQRRNRALAAAGLYALLVGCSRPAPQQAEAPALQPPPAAPAPAVELPKPPPLGRGELLQAVAAAADAFAVGQPEPAAATAVAGRQFELRMPFGCHGPPRETAPMRYAWDPAGRTLKLTAEPVVWTDPEWAGGLVDPAEVEAIEGFWLPRPWAASDACPPSASVPEVVPSPETVGLAQVYAKGGSRLLRRKGRPYEVTRKLAEDETPPQAGYRLVLAGRIVDGGAPIRCTAASRDVRPTCLVRVEFERVAFETADGQSIAEWRS